MGPIEIEFTLHPLKPEQPVMKISSGVNVTYVEIGQDKTGREIIAALNRLAQYEHEDALDAANPALQPNG